MSFCCKNQEKIKENKKEQKTKTMKILQAESLKKKKPPEKAGCGHLHQKTSFSAFAIVRDEEFLQSWRKEPPERR